MNVRGFNVPLLINLLRSTRTLLYSFDHFLVLSFTLLHLLSCVIVCWRLSLKKGHKSHNLAPNDLRSTSLSSRSRRHLSTNCYLPKSNLTALFPTWEEWIVNQEYNGLLVKYLLYTFKHNPSVFYRSSVCGRCLNITYESYLKLRHLLAC